MGSNVSQIVGDGELYEREYEADGLDFLLDLDLDDLDLELLDLPLLLPDELPYDEVGEYDLLPLLPPLPELELPLPDLPDDPLPDLSLYSV